VEGEIRFEDIDSGVSTVGMGESEGVGAACGGWLEVQRANQLVLGDVAGGVGEDLRIAASCWPGLRM
jgi:hypothetical protein